MNSHTNRLPRIVFIAVIGLAALQYGFYDRRLPERVASHFDGEGRANGWSSRGTFWGLYGGVVGLLAGIFLIVPAILRRIPPALINMPRKDYWLAPERRERTLAVFGAQLTWFGCASLVFLVALMQLVIQANLDRRFHLSPTTTWSMLGIYALYLVIWLVRMVRQFRIPK